MGYYVLSTPDGSKWDIPDTMREEEAFRRLKESNPEAFSTAVDEVETKTDTEKLVDLYNSRFTYDPRKSYGSTDDDPGLFSSLLAGFYEGVAEFPKAFAYTAAGATDSEELFNVTREKSEEFDQFIDTVSPAVGRTSFYDIGETYEKEGLLEAAGSTWDWVKQTTGQVLGYAAPAIAAGTAASYFASGTPLAPVAIPLSIFGTLLLQHMGNLYNAQIESGVIENAEDINILKTLAGAAPSAALDTVIFTATGIRTPTGALSPKGILGSLVGVQPSGAIQQEISKTLGRSILDGVAKGILIEPPTEITQQIIERLMRGESITSEDGSALREYLEVGAAAAVAGPLLRVGGNFMQNRAANQHMRSEKVLRNALDRRVKAGDVAAEEEIQRMDQEFYDRFNQELNSITLRGESVGASIKDILILAEDKNINLGKNGNDTGFRSFLLRKFNKSNLSELTVEERGRLYSTLSQMRPQFTLRGFNVSSVSEVDGAEAKLQAIADLKRRQGKKGPEEITIDNIIESLDLPKGTDPALAKRKARSVLSRLVARGMAYKQKNKFFLSPGKVGYTESQYYDAASAVAETGQFTDQTVTEATGIQDRRVIGRIRQDMERRGHLRREGGRYLPVDPRQAEGGPSVYWRAKTQKRDGTTRIGRTKYPTRAIAVAAARKDLERHQEPIKRGTPGAIRSDRTDPMRGERVTPEDIEEEYNALVAVRNERNRAEAERRVVPQVYSPDYRNLTTDEELVVNTAPMFVARDAEGEIQTARRPLRTRDGRSVNPFTGLEKAQLKREGVTISQAPETVSMVEERFFDEEGRLQQQRLARTREDKSRGLREGRPAIYATRDEAVSAMGREEAARKARPTREVVEEEIVTLPAEEAIALREKRLGPVTAAEEELRAEGALSLEKFAEVFRLMDGLLKQVIGGRGVSVRIQRSLTAALVNKKSQEIYRGVVQLPRDIALNELEGFAVKENGNISTAETYYAIRLALDAADGLDAGKTAGEVFESLKPALYHEIFHVMSAMDLFTEHERRLIERFVNKEILPRIKSMPAYQKRAIEEKWSERDWVEEAGAHMVEEYIENPGSIPGQQASYVRRIFNAVTKIGLAFAGEDITNPKQLMNAITSGYIGQRSNEEIRTIMLSDSPLESVKRLKAEALLTGWRPPQLIKAPVGEPEEGVAVAEVVDTEGVPVSLLEQRRRLLGQTAGARAAVAPTGRLSVLDARSEIPSPERQAGRTEFKRIVKEIPDLWHGAAHEDAWKRTKLGLQVYRPDLVKNMLMQAGLSNEEATLLISQAKAIPADTMHRPPRAPTGRLAVGRVETEPRSYQDLQDILEDSDLGVRIKGKHRGVEGFVPTIDQIDKSAAVFRGMVGAPIEDGQLVDTRINLNALPTHGAIQSIHDATTSAGREKSGHAYNPGDVLSYLPIVMLRHARFLTNQKERELVASGEKNKSPFASVRGEYVDIPVEDMDFSGMEIGYSPHKGHLFREIDTKYGIKSADEVVVVGHRVFARGDIEYYTAEEGKDLKQGNSQTDVEYVVEGGVPAGRMAISMDLESSELIHTPLGINGTGSRGQILGIDVARGLEDWVRHKIGRPILMQPPLAIAFKPELDYKTPFGGGLWDESIAEKIILNDSELLKATAMLNIKSDVEFMLSQPDAEVAKRWYNDVIKITEKLLVKLFPELRFKHNMVLFKALMAITSSGSTPNVNLRTAIRIYEASGRDFNNLPPTQIYENGDIILTKDKDGKMVPKGWSYRDSVRRGIIALNDLIKDKKEIGASKWLFSNHAIGPKKGSVKGLSKNTLRWYNSGVTIAGKADRMVPGSFMFGPKIGEYFLNINGNFEYITKDIWFSRSWNRALGTLVYEKVDKDGKRKLVTQDVPRNNAERKIMDEAVREVADTLGITPSEVQALWWYYEQLLWRSHGAKAESGNYADAATAILKEREIDIPRVRGFRRTDEAGWTPTDLKGISISPTTVTIPAPAGWTVRTGQAGLAGRAAVGGAERIPSLTGVIPPYLPEGRYAHSPVPYRTRESGREIQLDNKNLTPNVRIGEFTIRQPRIPGTTEPSWHEWASTEPTPRIITVPYEVLGDLDYLSYDLDLDTPTESNQYLKQILDSKYVSDRSGISFPSRPPPILATVMNISFTADGSTSIVPSAPGVANKVMSTVTDIVEDFISSVPGNSPTAIHFSGASEDSEYSTDVRPSGRESLYSFVSRRVGKRLGYAVFARRYTFSQRIGESGGYSNSTSHFLLIRKDALKDPDIDTLTNTTQFPYRRIDRPKDRVKLQEAERIGYHLPLSERETLKLTGRAAVGTIPDDVEINLDELLQSVRDNPGGFTIDLAGVPAVSGYVVAPVKATEKIIDSNVLSIGELKDYLAEHSDLFSLEGAHLGGWLDESSNEYLLDVSFPLDSYEDAVRVAIWADQDAIYNISTEEEIKTKDEQKRQIVPEGFAESIEEVQRSSPADIGAFAEASWRRSKGVRGEGRGPVDEELGAEEEGPVKGRAAVELPESRTLEQERIHAEERQNLSGRPTVVDQGPSQSPVGQEIHEYLGRIGFLRDGSLALPNTAGNVTTLSDLQVGREQDQKVENYQAVQEYLGNTIAPEADTSGAIYIYDLREVIGKTRLQIDVAIRNYMNRIGWKYRVMGPDEQGKGFTQPDFNLDGYWNNTIWIYQPWDPNRGFIGYEYSLPFRITHELGHAFTNNQISEMYGGMGRRAGAMGLVVRGPYRAPSVPLSLADGLRSLEWEAAAFKQQRQILEQSFGVLISDENFRKENAKNLADAVYRTLSGYFGPQNARVIPEPLDPDVALRRAKDLLRAAAYEMGLDQTERLDTMTEGTTGDEYSIIRRQLDPQLGGQYLGTPSDPVTRRNNWEVTKGRFALSPTEYNRARDVETNWFATPRYFTRGVYQGILEVPEDLLTGRFALGTQERPVEVEAALNAMGAVPTVWSSLLSLLEELDPTHSHTVWGVGPNSKQDIIDKVQSVSLKRWAASIGTSEASLAKLESDFLDIANDEIKVTSYSLLDKMLPQWGSSFSSRVNQDIKEKPLFKSLVSLLIPYQGQIYDIGKRWNELPFKDLANLGSATNRTVYDFLYDALSVMPENIRGFRATPKDARRPPLPGGVPRRGPLHRGPGNPASRLNYAVKQLKYDMALAGMSDINDLARQMGIVENWISRYGSGVLPSGVFEWVHGTDVDMDEMLVEMFGGMGMHFGSGAQAINRLDRISPNNHARRRYIRALVNLEYPIRFPDLGGWEPESVLGSLIPRFHTMQIQYGDIDLSDVLSEHLLPFRADTYNENKSIIEDGISDYNLSKLDELGISPFIVPVLWDLREKVRRGDRSPIDISYSNDLSTVKTFIDMKMAVSDWIQKMDDTNFSEVDVSEYVGGHAAGFIEEVFQDPRKTLTVGSDKGVAFTLPPSVTDKIFDIGFLGDLVGLGVRDYPYPSIAAAMKRILGNESLDSGINASTTLDNIKSVVSGDMDIDSLRTYFSTPITDIMVSDYRDSGWGGIIAMMNDVILDKPHLTLWDSDTDTYTKQIPTDLISGLVRNNQLSYAVTKLSAIIDTASLMLTLHDIWSDGTRFNLINTVMEDLADAREIARIGVFGERTPGQAEKYAVESRHPTITEAYVKYANRVMEKTRKSYSEELTRSFVSSFGFDGGVYDNGVEGYGDSVISFDPKNQVQVLQPDEFTWDFVYGGPTPAWFKEIDEKIGTPRPAEGLDPKPLLQSSLFEDNDQAHAKTPAEIGMYIPKFGNGATDRDIELANNPELATPLPESVKGRYSMSTRESDGRSEPRTAEENRVINQMIPANPSGNLWDRLKHVFDDDWVLHFRELALDKYERIQRVSDKRTELQKKLGFADTLSMASATAIGAVRMIDQAKVYLSAVLKYGPINLVVTKNGSYAKVRDNKLISDEAWTFTKEFGGPMEFFAPLYQDENNNPRNLSRDFQTVAIVRRGTRIGMERGKPAVIELGKAEEEVAKSLVKKYPVLETVYKNYESWNKGMVDFMVQSEYVTPEVGEKFRKYMDYIPFYRDQLGGENLASLKLWAQEELGDENYKVFQSLITAKQPKRLKQGPKDNFMEMFEGISRNALAIITAGLTNIAGQRLMADLEALGEAKRLPKDAKKSDFENVFEIRELGEPVLYQVQDPLLVSVLQTAQDGFIDVPAYRFGAFASRGLRELVTRNPAFWVRNMLRDTLAVWVMSGAKYQPFTGTLKMFVKNWRAYRKGEVQSSFQELEKLGVIGGYELGRAETTGKIMERRFAAMSGKKGMSTRMWKLWDKMGEYSSFSEAATRQLIFNEGIATHGNEMQASSAAMEILNFSRRGGSKAVRFVMGWWPFLNARVQGADALYRGATGQLNLTQDEIKMFGPFARSFVLRSMVLAGMSATWALMTGDMDDEDNIRKEIIDDNWLIPMPGDIPPIGIPSPFEAGILVKLIPELFVKYMMGTRDGHQVYGSLKHAAVSQFALSPLPQFLEPSAEALYNYSLFTGRDIVPFYMENELVETQYKPTTNVLAVKIGQTVGIAPLKVEHVMRGYTGSIGSYVLHFTDMILRGAGLSETLPLNFWKQPFIRDVFKHGIGEGSEADYYAFREAVEAVVASVDKYKRTGRIEEAWEIQRKYESLYSMKDAKNAIDRLLKSLRAEKVMIILSDMGTLEKNSAAKSIDERIQYVLRNTKELYKQADMPIGFPFSPI